MSKTNLKAYTFAATATRDGYTKVFPFLSIDKSIDRAKAKAIEFLMDAAPDSSYNISDPQEVRQDIIDTIKKHF